ncbi:hypothetical protein F4821DRAFT_41969 [Hypoxylon rubiginosum]|uniref:Uncharacterized protein n=1 Tax=Hypoxylon rubiginosum TaxID=110542 RepID=A0ACC0CKL6_9PEZI|nr:hypothetical protein F4821DRAFT_41969 [Hypoxylon rubiginosum]
MVLLPSVLISSIHPTCAGFVAQSTTIKWKRARLAATSPAIGRRTAWNPADEMAKNSRKYSNQFRAWISVRHRKRHKRSTVPTGRRTVLRISSVWVTTDAIVCRVVTAPYMKR